MAKTLKILPVLAIGIPLLLILGMMFVGMVGFFPGMASSQRNYAASDWGGSSNGRLAAMPAYEGGLNWYYNPFENPMNAMLFLLFCIAAPIITALRLNTEEWKTMGAAALGTFFLSGAVIVTIGAFQNLFSMRPNAGYGVDAGDLYGWVFLDIILVGIGGALLYLAEKWRMEKGSARPVYSVVAHTAGLFVATYAAFLFLFSSAEAADVLKRSMEGNGWANDIVLNPVKMFGWLFYSAALFYIAYRLLVFSKKGAGEMAGYALHTPVSYIGAISLCGAVFYTLLFLAGVVSALTNSYYGPKLSIFDLALAILFNIVALYAARWLAARQMAIGIPRTAHLWLMCAGSLIALVMLFAGIFALYSVLSSNSPSDSWRMLFFTLLSLGYGGGLICAAKGFAAREYAEKKAQAGSLLNSLYGEEEKQAASAADAGLAELRLRIIKLESKVARLEAAKRK